MGFEIAAGLGAKLAMPERHVVVLVGDMSFLMMNGELVTGAQLGIPFTVVVFDNRGGQSIRGLQKRSGFADFGMEFGRASASGGAVQIDFAAMAEAMACRGLRARDAKELENALAEAATTSDRPTVIDVKLDKDDFMGGYGGWWDVPQPEVDEQGHPREERARYLAEKKKQVVR
jgi:3D-(3,5/4)-trihydroxycyclohexane-1,2-dione acylhydrolase (decyclizing)